MRHIFILFLLLAASTGYSQDYVAEEELEPRSISDNFVIDTNLALQLGSITVVGANPQLGFQVSRRSVIGFGYSYYLSTYKFINQPRINDKLHGPTAFGRFLISDNIFLRTDYQRMNYIIDSGATIPDTFQRDRWFVGGGYRASITWRASFTSGIYLDLLDPVGQPIFRTGVEYAIGGWRSE